MREGALIFVYGTLKRGGCRAGLLVGQRLLGEAETEPRYRMFDCGSYPGLIDAEAGQSIKGELCAVDAECLRALDLAEGVAEGLYARRPIRLLAPYADEIVEAYFYLPSTAGLPDCGVCWINASGVT
jgi:gamma-glutamylcyclotransferase (GGCT)/AIG2-like uncharacterized protein YtfP